MKVIVPIKLTDTLVFNKQCESYSCIGSKVVLAVRLILGCCLQEQCCNHLYRYEQESLAPAQMADFVSLVELLQTRQEELHSLEFLNLFRFVIYASRLKDDILLVQPAEHSPDTAPQLLPASVRAFLSNVCGFSLEMTDLCWTGLKGVVWSNSCVRMTESFDGFKEHGERHGLGLFSSELHTTTVGINTLAVSWPLYPPEHMCRNSLCMRSAKGLALKKAEQRQGVLYTLASGALAIWSVHLYCESE